MALSNTFLSLGSAQDFSEWNRIPALGDHYTIKCSTIELSDTIEQTLHIRPNAGNMSFNVCHRFLKLSHQEFETFLKRSCWSLSQSITDFHARILRPL